MLAANAAAINEHLKELSTQVTPGSIAVAIRDGPGWHQRGKELVWAKQYSPAVPAAIFAGTDPTENVWDYLRQNKLCARVNRL